MSAPKPILDWMPGTPGKGMMLGSGQVVLWSTDRDARPWHSQRARALGAERDYHSSITIAPNGVAVPSGLILERPQPASGREAEVAAVHPRIKLSSVEEYRRTGEPAYGHADRLMEVLRARQAPAQLAAMPASARAALAKLPPRPESDQAHTRAKVVLGTTTWRVEPELEELGQKLLALFPSAAGASCSVKRELVMSGLYGFQLLTVRFRLPGESYQLEGRTFFRALPGSGAIERELGEWLLERAALLRPKLKLAHFPLGIAPAPLSEAAWSAYQRVEEARREEEDRLQPRREECEAVLEYLERERGEDYKVFRCERDIQAGTGLTPDRAWRVLSHLTAQGALCSGGFHTRAGGMGGWYSLQPGPVRRRVLSRCLT